MKNLLTFLMLIFSTILGFAQYSNNDTTIPIVTLNQIDSIIKSKNKFTSLYFWPTWCLPCLKHIPELVDAHEKAKTSLVLVAEPFSNENNLLSLRQKYKNLNVSVYRLANYDNRKIAFDRTRNIKYFNAHFTKRDSALNKIKDIDLRNPSFYIIDNDLQIIYTNIDSFNINTIKVILEKLN